MGRTGEGDGPADREGGGAEQSEEPASGTPECVAHAISLSGVGCSGVLGSAEALRQRIWYGPIHPVKEKSGIGPYRLGASVPEGRGQPRDEPRRTRGRPVT
ncbi:hypothetical protein GCM10010300_31720 [Streptomyces olivaceoviridis]|nr:hypothetical protein GCM10010300_31720 [Streptomyces olivaceoviridis]